MIGCLQSSSADTIKRRFGGWQVKRADQQFATTLGQIDRCPQQPGSISSPIHSSEISRPSRDLPFEPVKAAVDEVQIGLDSALIHHRVSPHLADQQVHEKVLEHCRCRASRSKASKVRVSTLLRAGPGQGSGQRQLVGATSICQPWSSGAMKWSPPAPVRPVSARSVVRWYKSQGRVVGRMQLSYFAHSRAAGPAPFFRPVMAACQPASPTLAG